MKPANGKTMLAAAVAGNQIDIGLQAVADFFEMNGWRAIQLGANVPTSDIVRAVDDFEADLLGLSVSQALQLETVCTVIASVRSAQRGEHVKIIVGGFAFAGSEHLAQQLGADGYAPDPSSAVELGNQLVFGTSSPAVADDSPACGRASEAHPTGTDPSRVVGMSFFTEEGEHAGWDTLAAQPPEAAGTNMKTAGLPRCQT
jgi:cobalamin-dependent methionine synthase I